MREIVNILLVATGAFLWAQQTYGQPTEPSLSETLAWMDSTYNSHRDEGGAWGHGLEENDADGKMFKRNTETLGYDGCNLTLISENDPYSPAYSEMYSSKSYKFSLRDIDPESIKMYPYDSRSGGLSCEIAPNVMTCDMTKMEFETRNQAALIETDTHTVFPKLQGRDHDSTFKSKTFVSVFYLDDLQYAQRFAKAFRHAIALCGGKASAF